MVYSDHKKESVNKLPTIAKLLFGGLCGMVATVVVHPLDLVKVRMQMYPEPSTNIAMGRRIIRCEGFRALYTGVTAGLLRQATHTTTRLGVYYWLYEEYRQKFAKTPSLTDKMLIGACAGLAGAFAGNPSEVALVRMMADGKRDPCNKYGSGRRYRGVFDAINKISCNEGPRALWRGGTLTLTRSVFVSFAQIGTYTQAREILKERMIAEDIKLHLYTSVISSFFTSCLTLPVDLIKTRFQVDKDGKKITQKEIIHDIVKNQGVKSFWKGFIPYFLRLSMHTAITYMILEELNEYYINRYKHDPKKDK